MEDFAALFREKGAWGLLTSVDLYRCCPHTLKDPERIRQSVRELARLINANLFGETILARFGASEKVCGYSLLQLIDSSSLSAHYVESSHQIFFDLFSCQPYEPQKAVDYLKDFYQAQEVNAVALFRGLPEGMLVQKIFPSGKKPKQ